jgi:hypothetical protein
MMLEHSLATESALGVNVKKRHITLAVCGNTDGNNKGRLIYFYFDKGNIFMQVPLLIIGWYTNPRCFMHVNHDSLGCVYQYNQTAWMNTSIIVEWLECFDRRMNRWRVLLLLDNFSEHTCALEM